MASFGERFKESLREEFENRTGIVGRALRSRREKQINTEYDAIKQTTGVVRSTRATLTNMEVALIQISKNFQAINRSFNVVVTLQDEDNKVQAVRVDKKMDQTQIRPTALHKVGKDMEELDNSMWDQISGLFDLMGGGGKRRIPKPTTKQRAKKAGKEAYKKARKGGASRAEAKKAAEAARKKAIERAAKAQKRLAELALKKAAQGAGKKIGREAIKKIALKIISRNFAKAAIKSIPFAGIAGGVAFGVAKLLQGDVVGAGLEVIGGAGGPLTSIPATVASTVRDTYFEMYGVYPESDPYRSERFAEVKEVVTEAAEEKLAELSAPSQAQARPPAAATAPTVAAPSAVQPSAPAAPSAAASAPVLAPAPPAPPPAPMSKPGPAAAEGMTGRARQLADALREMGITGSAGIQAIVAAVAKESGLDPNSKELGASSWLASLEKRGIEYIYKIFPQLGPGGRLAVSLGFPNGVQKDFLLREWSKGDEAFFTMMYGGLSTNREPKDGYLYRGRGLIQITGRSVYKKVGALLGIDLEGNPDLITRDFGVASKAAAVYIADALGSGNFKKGIDILNNFKDPKEALKWVVGNIASGGLGYDEARYQRLFGDTTKGIGLSTATQFEKASKFASLGAEVAGTSVDVASARQQTQQNNVTVVTINETNTKRKQAPSGGAAQQAATVG